MRLTLLFSLLTLSAIAQPTQRYVITAPAGSEYTKIDKAGRTVLPNGRFITPRGRQIQTAPHPYGLVLSPDRGDGVGTTVVTANSGINPFSISILRNVLSENPVVQQVPEGVKTDNGILEACFMGLAISPGGNGQPNKVVYVAGGETNKIFAFDLATGKPAGTIDCRVRTATQDFTHGYIGDMVMTRDGKTLYAVDQIGFRMLVIDLATKKILHNVPTGRYPFGITLSPDEKTAYVANVGVFEYKPFSDLDRKDLKKTAHDYPASKYGSKEMREGDAAKGIPALGDPNAPEAFSVWTINLSGTPTVKAKIKTGFLVGQMVEDFPAVGGSSPNSVVATDQYVFVSNGNNDCVSVIDVKTSAVIKNMALTPDSRLGNLRGVIPFGLALAPDQKRLYVAEAGINAVAVIDVPTLAVLGHIPTGWFPSKLKVSSDRDGGPGKKLIVANAKGYGSGPNGGRTFKLGPQGSYIGSLMNGTVSVIDIPADADLKAETEQVVQNNFTIRPVADLKPTTNPIPAYVGQKSSPAGQTRNGNSPIKHIVFIAKENRTYDEIFGKMTNGDGDSTLARYSVGVTVKSKRGNQTVGNASVMPNHLGLARRFAMADNFYCDSDVSADGHRWLVNTYPNEWVETGTAAAYGGKRNLRDSSNAPGNLSFYGSAGSIYPEDYNEGGSMWDHLERWKKDFFNFGFGVEMAGAYSDSTMKYIGEKYTINYPLPAPLFDRSSRTFPTYNMAVPDQFRTDVFMKEFKEKWLRPDGSVGKDTLPPVITLMLPNDHGTNPRPKAGFPFTESYMADNDLALGRAVEFLSQTPYWKSMAIFVVEDDPQGGVDHVDAHRSLMVAISPYVKRNYVGHVHYSFGSVFKTFWNILGIPCLNQYDAGATDLADLFTDQPDFTPYRALPADVRLFDPQKALDPFDEKFDWKAFSESEELDRTETMQKRRAEDDAEQRQKAGRKRKPKG